MGQLSMQGGGGPLAPLTVQTSQASYHQPQQSQQVLYQHHQPQMIPGHLQHPQQHQQQFPLMPPSAFGPGQGNLNLPHPGMEQQPQFSQRLPHGGGISGPVQYQDPAIMSLSKMPPPQAQFPPQYQQQHQQFPAQSRPVFSSPATVPGMKTLADIEAEMMFGQARPGGPPQPQVMERGGHVGHIHPALHNLNYPGMRDRQQQPPPSQQQQRQQQQQQQQQPPPFHQHQQFRHSPGLTNQQQLQQGLQQQVKLNQQQHQQQYRGPRGPQFEGKNMRFSDSRHQGYDRRREEQDRQGGGGRRPYHDPNRMNEETFGSTEVGDQSVTRRDLMPGHVHTLGILRHSRSRHDRH